MSSKSGQNKQVEWEKQLIWEGSFMDGGLKQKRVWESASKYFEAVKKSLFKDTWERRKEVKLINVSPLFCQDVQLLNAPIF